MEEGARKRPLFVVPSLADAKKRVLEATAAEPSAFELHQQQKKQQEQKQPQREDRQHQSYRQSSTHSSQQPRASTQPEPQLATKPLSQQQVPSSTINSNFSVPPQPSPSQATNIAHAPRSAVAPSAVSRGANPRPQMTAANSAGTASWAVPQKPWAGRGSTSTSSSSTSGAPKVLVNRARQARNPIVGLIRACPVELVEEQVADFQLGVGCGCLFVQVKYHLLHPEYLTRRLRELSGFGGPRLKLVLCLVDADERHALLAINTQCLVHDATLLLAWSWEEAARYLETFRCYEHKPPTTIMARASDDYVGRLADVLGCVRSVNKTDAATLASNFGSVKAMALASREELARCPGLGGKKVERLYAALHAPFPGAKNKHKKKSDTGRAGSIKEPSDSTVGNSSVPVPSSGSVVDVHVDATGISDLAS